MVPRAHPKPRAQTQPSKLGRLSRVTLKRLIAHKVDTLDVAGLRRLAIELHIALSDESPGTAKRQTPIPKTSRRARPKVTGVPAPLELVGWGTGELVNLEQGAVGLDTVTIDDSATDWAQSELLGAGEMAARLRVSRATLDNWRTASKALAFRKGVRNYVYPARQFERFGPVEGLDRVLPHFAAAEDAWEWLVTPNRITQGDIPLDRLRAGHLAEVERAAEGALDYA